MELYLLYRCWGRNLQCPGFRINNSLQHRQVWAKSTVSIPNHHNHLSICGLWTKKCQIMMPFVMSTLFPISGQRHLSATWSNYIKYLWTELRCSGKPATNQCMRPGIYKLIFKLFHTRWRQTRAMRIWRFCPTPRIWSLTPKETSTTSRKYLG